MIPPARVVVIARVPSRPEEPFFVPISPEPTPCTWFNDSSRGKRSLVDMFGAQSPQPIEGRWANSSNGIGDFERARRTTAVSAFLSIIIRLLFRVQPHFEVCVHFTLGRRCVITSCRDRMICHLCQCAKTQFDHPSSNHPTSAHFPYL
jgi:hypothetical protein